MAVSRRQATGLVTLLATRPLVLHVSVYNPATSSERVLVPRMLLPVGTLLQIAVLDVDGATLWRSSAVKAALKLHPDRPDSYVELEPGYSHGAVVSLDTVTEVARAAAVTVSYSCSVFTGPAGRTVDLRTFEITVPVLSRDS